MSDQEHGTFALTIDYSSVRKNFQNDMNIYGGAMIRAIKRGDAHLSQVIEADDIHGFMAALNIAMHSIDSQEALDELREVVADITTRLADANQARRMNDGGRCPECGALERYDLGDHFECFECGCEWDKEAEDEDKD